MNEGYYAFQYLKKYYNFEDITLKYGVSRMEIKHSNYLKWILCYDYLEYFPIKCLLLYLKTKTNKLNDINIYNEVKNLNIERETENIDMLITFDINGKNILLLIENKINADLSRKDQLESYLEKINTKKYSKYDIKIPVLLHPDYDNNKSKNMVNKAKENGYIIMKPIHFVNYYSFFLNK